MRLDHGQLPTDHLVQSLVLAALAAFARDVPSPSADDDHIRSGVIAAIGQAVRRPCRLNVVVREGTVSLTGVIKSDIARRAAIVAAENGPGVRKVQDYFYVYPPSEEDLGGGDFVSLQEQPSTADDEPL